MDERAQSVLELTDVSKRFRSDGRETQALQNINIAIAPGQVTGLIGPDGAGKTTLMRIATSLLPVDAGTVKVLGLDAESNPLAVQSAVAYMPQRFGLYEDLTVQENLDLYANLQGVAKAERVPRYQELMHMTGLAPFTSRRAGKLSGGMKQKLGLACVLVKPQRLLMLDEPTVGVDPVSRRELWAIVYRLVRAQGMSVLLSTAYLDEAERCDEVILLHEGKVLSSGTPQSFSEPMQGRSFAVTATGFGKRGLQERLSLAPGVVDSVIQGEHVRIVMETAEPPSAQALLPNVHNVQIKVVPPRFEDYFVAELKVAQTTVDAATEVNPSTPAHTTLASDVPVIEVRAVRRRFGDFYAVNNISFDVSRGEVFGLLGANGAGKSTTFRMLCGLLPVSAGTLFVAGQDLRRAAAAARSRLGYMAQKFALYGLLSVRENLRFFGSAYGLSGKRRRQRIQWALDEFELGEVADAHSGTLPLGYKQRLALACALMHEPEILFLDEPTSGVDPLARRAFWRRITHLAEQGVTILVTTHFMEEAEYCDRLAIMAAGEILTLGTPAEIKHSTRSAQQPNPSMEDAFIELIQTHEAAL